MGLFNALVGLLDENSDQSFEKKIISAIDRVEDALNSSLDKAEEGIKKADAAVTRIDNTTQRYVDKAGETTAKAVNVIDVIDKKVQG